MGHYFLDIQSLIVRLNIISKSPLDGPGFQLDCRSVRWSFYRLYKHQILSLKSKNLHLFGLNLSSRGGGG